MPWPTLCESVEAQWARDIQRAQRDEEVIASFSLDEQQRYRRLGPLADIPWGTLYRYTTTDTSHGKLRTTSRILYTAKPYEDRDDHFDLILFLKGWHIDEMVFTMSDAFTVLIERIR